MDVKEKLLALKEKLKTTQTKIDSIEEIVNNNDDELENHYPNNETAYRFHYINFDDFDESLDNLGIIDYNSTPFKLPIGMSRDDAFKILSYLMDYITNLKNLETNSIKSVLMLNQILNLQRLGFTKIARNIKEENVADLFIIDGQPSFFKQSEFYSKYFGWYQKGISFDEIKEIYNKYSIEFCDVVIEDDYTLTIHPKAV